jgi:uncharacterized zinc-type alcohol dehydrogenase-like protein
MPYLLPKDPETFERLSNTFDLVINTISATSDMKGYLSLLRLGGTLVNVGLPEEPLAARTSPRPTTGSWTVTCATAS